MFRVLIQISILICSILLSAMTWVSLDELVQLPPYQRYEQLKSRVLHNNLEQTLPAVEKLANQFKSEGFSEGVLLCQVITIVKMDFYNVKERKLIREKLNLMKAPFLQSSDFMKAMYYHLEGRLHYFDEKNDLALKSHLQALSFAHGIETVPILISIANTYYWINAFEKAIEYGKNVLTLIDQNEMNLLAPRVNELLGDIYFGKGELAASNDYLFKSLEQSRNLGDYKRQVYALHSIVNIKIQLGHYNLAKKYLYDAKLLLDKPGINAHQKVKTFIYLGRVYRYLKDFDNSNKYLLKAQEISSENNMLSEIIVSSLVMADNLINKEKFDSAISLLLGLSTIEKKYWYESTIGEYHFHLAQAYLFSEKLENVEPHILKAIASWKATGNNLELAYELAVKFYAKIGNYRKAYLYQMLHYEQSEKTSKELLQKKAYARENQYLFADNEKKQLILEKQNERMVMLVTFVCFIVIFFSTVLVLIKKSIKKTKLLNIEKLNSEIRTRSLLDQMQPHFLFNSLNSISNLIYESTDKADEYIVKLSDMYRLILQGSQSYTWEISNEIKLVEDYLKLQELRFEDQISYQINYQDHELEKVECPCLMLHTLVENAIKHGVALNPEGGQIIINISRESSAYRLSVENTGSGDDCEIVIRGTGTGIENTRKRLRNMYGSKSRLLTKFSSEWSKVEFFISGERISSISDSA